MKQESSVAVQDVVNERRRQIEVECFSAENDDKLIDCQLACAAACYAMCDTQKHLNEFTIMGVPIWPWGPVWWRSTTYRQNLVKAAALLIAEIEHIDRKDRIQK